MNGPAVDGNPFEQVARGRRRYGKDAVGAMDEARANVDGRGHDLFRRQIMDEVAGRRNIGNGVKVSDFMEMNLRDWFLMGPTFSFGKGIIDSMDIGLDGICQMKVLYNGFDIGQVMMGMVMVVMPRFPVFMMVCMFMVVLVMPCVPGWYRARRRKARKGFMVQDIEGLFLLATD